MAAAQPYKAGKKARNVSMLHEGEKKDRSDCPAQKQRYREFNYNIIINGYSEEYVLCNC